MYNNNFYKKHIAPVLPTKILDFHTHIWRSDQWLENISDTTGASYMVTERDYTAEQLITNGDNHFPYKIYHALTFGQPTPAVNITATNDYVAASVMAEKRLFPLLVAGNSSVKIDEIKMRLDSQGFLGYKVFLNWFGNNYGHICIDDMLNSTEMEIANERRLIVLLHVPGAKRLADEKIQAGVKKLSVQYPNAKIVLAHCGRCYHPLEINSAVRAVCDLENVYMDSSMVMEPYVISTVIRALGPERLLFATDYPVAAMIGKRVNIMDHWVDVVTAGYPESEYRVGSDNFGAIPMAQEIALSIILGADTAGISSTQLNGIFYDNGMKLIRA